MSGGFCAWSGNKDASGAARGIPFVVGERVERWVILLIGVVAGVFHEWGRGVARGAWVVSRARCVYVAGGRQWVVVGDVVGWVRVGNIRYVVLCNRMKWRVGGHVGGKVGHESVEEGDVAIAVGGGMVALGR